MHSFISVFYFILASPRPPRVNSAHPIIRSVEGTSSRFFLLPGTESVGRIAVQRIGSVVATCSGSASGGEESRCSEPVHGETSPRPHQHPGGSFMAKQQSFISSTFNKESLEGRRGVGGSLLVFDYHTRLFSLFKPNICRLNNVRI